MHSPGALEDTGPPLDAVDDKDGDVVTGPTLVLVTLNRFYLIKCILTVCRYS